MGPKQPLIAIVGPTASGKTALAIDIAREYSGEIICADSRTVYKGMDISTAKPSPEERQAAPHHVLDVAKPSSVYTVADFQRDANEAIDDVLRRGKLPLLVGGSGLFIDSVIYDFAFRDKPDNLLRKKLEQMSVDELQTIIKQKNLAMPENKQNPRHLMRVIETSGQASHKKPLRKDTLLVGIDVPRETLKERIKRRVDIMEQHGLLDEIKEMSNTYGWDTQALQTPAFKAFKKYFKGKCTFEQAKDLFVQGDYKLAKRQYTWLRRNRDISWVETPEQAKQMVQRFMSKYLLQ